jgi:hypothetical protein
MLRWSLPRLGLCTYVETSAAINGLDIVGLIKKRPTLLEACDLFDIPHMAAEHTCARHHPGQHRVHPAAMA